MKTVPSPQYHDPPETEMPEQPGCLFRMLADKRRELLFWSLNCAFWITLGLIGYLISRAFRSAVPDIGVALCMRMATGFVLTAGLRMAYRHAGFRERNRLMKWALVLGCCTLAALLEMFAHGWLQTAGFTVPGGAENAGLRLLCVRLFTLMFWSGLYFGFHVIENEHAMELRATRAELAAREYELRHLQARMIPHFVFNALNAVLACRHDPAGVAAVTESLGAYLHFTLEETRPLEPLARELDALEKYLTVESSHFRENLICRIQCDAATRAVMVPPMIIQPLLENAFQNRPQSPGQPLQIWLTSRIEAGFLRITLSHTCEPEAAASDKGQMDDGIVALRQRLELLLGPRAGVEREMDKGWIRFTIQIPLPR